MHNKQNFFKLPLHIPLMLKRVVVKILDYILQHAKFWGHYFINFKYYSSIQSCKNGNATYVKFNYF